jgi:hypothetical protein
VVAQANQAIELARAVRSLRKWRGSSHVYDVRAEHGGFPAIAGFVATLVSLVSLCMRLGFDLLFFFEIRQHS